MNLADKTILGVIFDMDGVLCDSEPFICEAAQRLFVERYGVNVPAEDFIPFFGAGETRDTGGPPQGVTGQKNGRRVKDDLVVRGHRWGEETSSLFAGE